MKKIILSFLTLVFAAGLAFGMPVFTSYLPDTSGEYVYYRDKSFERESYIGILYYDDETFELRYFAPKSESNFLPEKEIELLVSVDKKANHWEMKGERILSSINPSPDSDDAQIINYLHDLMYEFSSRRSKQPEVTFANQNDLTHFTDYAQFGGQVKIVYDCVVPLFNIRSIENADGDKIFDCVTFGQIKSNTDTTFADFKGFGTAGENNGSAKVYKKAKTVHAVYEKQNVQLDKNWTQQLENFWTLNEDSLIALSEIPLFFDDFIKNACFFIRKLNLSSENSYTDFSNTEYRILGSSIKIYSKTFQVKSGRMIVNTKLLSKIPGKTSMSYFSIATYENSYKKNQSYFEKIIKSYSNR